MAFGTENAQRRPEERRARVQGGVLGLGLAGLACLMLLGAVHGGSARLPALALTGWAIGVCLIKSSFGFAGGFRAVVERRDFTGFKAQAVSLAVASVFFFPVLAAGKMGWINAAGYGSPVSLPFLGGALAFGIGMQLGGGCASGTLFGLGGGNLRLAVTLAFFLVGSVWGAHDIGYWQGFATIPLGSLQDHLGWGRGLFLQVLMLAAAALLLPGRLELARKEARDLLFGSWPVVYGALALAALSILTLVLAGRPWGETSGFTLWASKIVSVLGAHPEAWTYWRGSATMLNQSIFTDITSVMDFGILLGALSGAALSGSFRVRRPGNLSQVGGAVLGGVLMGYGARLSNGCNIGAYYSAMASGSLSSWVWLCTAYAGSVLAIRGISFARRLIS